MDVVLCFKVLASRFVAIKSLILMDGLDVYRLHHHFYNVFILNENVILNTAVLSVVST